MPLYTHKNKFWIKLTTSIYFPNPKVKAYKTIFYAMFCTAVEHGVFEERTYITRTAGKLNICRDEDTGECREIT
jgi:hypothetical protein